MGVVGEMLHKEVHRLVATVTSRELVVVEHQQHLSLHPTKLVHEHGKYGIYDTRAGDAKRRENAGPEPFTSRAPVQRLDYVPPQADRIIVLLVEGDPGKDPIGSPRAQPLGQEYRLAVPGRGADEGDLAIEPLLEHLKKPGTQHLFGSRRRHAQLGPDYRRHGGVGRCRTAHSLHNVTLLSIFF